MSAPSRELSLTSRVTCWGGELGCAGLDLAAEDLSVADTEDVCLGLIAVVGAEPHVDAGKEVGLLSLPLERGDGEQMRQYSLVAEQVEVATEPVVDSQCRAGLYSAGLEQPGQVARAVASANGTKLGSPQTPQLMLRPRSAQPTAHNRSSAAVAPTTAASRCSWSALRYRRSDRPPQ